MSLSCVILAAGLGTRMKSDLPKVLHKVCGIPMLQAVVNAARKLRPDRIVLVVGKQRELIRDAIECEGGVYALQKEAKGTGHALRCAKPALGDFRDLTVVLSGDTPLLGAETLRRFLSLHRKNTNEVSVLSFRAKNPGAYGRIVRDRTGRLLSIVEQRDADPVQLRIDEVNSGVYALGRNALELVDGIPMNKAKGEFYLTDLVGAASERGLKAAAYCIGEEEEFMGVNTREELYRASQALRKRIIDKWIGRGVNVLDAGSVFIHPDVSIGRETTIYPNVHLEGNTRIGRNSLIYPNVRIRNSVIGGGVVIKDSTVIEDSRVGDRVSVGPFARIRPGSEIGENAKIGNFVELKNTTVGKASKASHLSYLGDAVIGKNVNIGAGTITCNYDGVRKHATEIGDGVFIGSDTQLVAPVRVGAGAYVGAGATITEDVPPCSLALSRVKQLNIEGWTLKRKLKVRSMKFKTKGGKRR
ncbi:MAG: bifunctional UDP-N-acetylglucosamine diphosphorylase/glucosamine-1-phosphate N-acetyltransferase GlmU [Nitrospirae bacterium]|nr:bifunctional UDP-N-acetylglucosamine diphosphorylase/glucosamine-1-phosphate N-acetyltransferase GlmU [Nitrospirota bacterium]